MNDEEKQLLDLLSSMIAETIYEESIENLNEAVFKPGTIPPQDETWTFLRYKIMILNKIGYSNE